jgi:glucan phosphoethanolaminetransferase (alkaline phosphatase superfamily)
LKTDFYKIREVIAADSANRGKPVLDSILVAELEASMAKHTKGRQVVVLHTKGSHFSYASRYTREFARYQPECSGADGVCSTAELINAYDNSVLYTDTFLHTLMQSLKGKKAFEQLQIAAQSANATETGVGHVNLFDSMLGCLGITSNNGGIDDKYNLCH